MKQVTHLHHKFDELQKKYGDINLRSIYGAGETNSPSIMFIFMNPTGRNISSSPEWEGLRAPWLGTNQVWNIFNSLDLFDKNLFKRINTIKPRDWDIDFAQEVYSDIMNNSVYITNLAKCTQIDARPLKNAVFKEYLDLMFEEIEYIKPKKIISFGNQVSSILLNRNIKVSDYDKDKKEILTIQKTFDVYPTFYPVGQGRRNLPKAIERIKIILSEK